MALPASTDPLTALIETLPEYRRLLENNYFTALKSGSMSREVFRHSQRQFYFAVRFFSRPMAALMARMPVSGLRQGLIHNLAEEHGFEDEDGPAMFNPKAAHDLTMLKFLNTLGVLSEDMRHEREGAAARAFNLALLGACLMERTEFAFACLGAIEYSFAEISSLIGKTVVGRGWISDDDLVHYRLHAEIDKRHAADFLSPLESGWTSGGETCQAVEDGLVFGLHVFDQFYANLHRDALALQS